MENTGITYPFSPAHTGLTDLRTALGDWSVSIEEGTTDYIPIEDTLPGLKRYYNGWQNGDLIIIGGRHGAGKTSLILDILKATSIDHDIPSLCIVPQSKSSSILLRLIRKYSDQYGGNSPEALQYIAGNVNLSQCPLYIDDTPRLDITRLSAFIQEWMETYGIRIVAIDPFQSITESTYFTHNPIQGSNYITREFKSIARELDIPILVTSGLDNCPSKHRTSKLPTLDDLSLTGSAVYDADLIIIMHRPQYTNGSETFEPTQCQFIIPKNRHGPTGEFVMTFSQTTLSFHEPRSPFIDTETL